MEELNDDNKILLPHHEQHTLCTTRLPYRQGRKLTAVKVYSISKESNHLLIFGVPSLNLRQETRALFVNFGRLLQFNISKEHACETFTETYHARYERIQSARLAKRMLDTKNFYGGSLHVCYAPELEGVDETRQKLMQRQRDVTSRLDVLHKEGNSHVETSTPIETPVKEIVKLNMGNINTISTGKQVRRVVNKKRKLVDNRKFEPCFIQDKKKTRHSSNITINNIDHNHITFSDSTNKLNNEEVSVDRNKITECNNVTISNLPVKYDNSEKVNIDSHNITDGSRSNDIEVIDCTGLNAEVITNINECLNYNKFGNEIVKKVPQKPVNKIQFYINKKS